ncbi:MAG: pirin family protein [Methylosarcina sp.]
MGSGSIIKPCDVQMISTGTGFTHSEFNPSSTECMHFLQIWIATNVKNVKPRYRRWGIVAQRPIKTHRRLQNQ